MKKNLHNLQNQQVVAGKQLFDPQIQLVDVRSPKEFQDGGIPTAVNIPLLDDEERHIIGLMYKEKGPALAIEQGYDFCTPKIETFKAQFAKFPEKKIVIYCARGGMRSGVITALLSKLGIPALQLAGGYKSFRTWTLQFFADITIPNLMVLQGKTGVGKTLLLHKLPNIVDLEGVAHHRGSMFGGVGRTATTQKWFEGDLLHQICLLDSKAPVYIEGESKKIGKVNLPSALFVYMKASPTILIHAAPDTRAKRLEEEYIQENLSELDTIRYFVSTLKESLGKQRVAELLGFYDQGDYFECIKAVLVEYYDLKYSFSLDKMQYVTELDSENLDAAVQQIQEFSTDYFKGA